MERNHTIDTLRTIATLLVILLHVSAGYVNSGMNNSTYDKSFWAGNILDSLSRICVPLFVLISGRFLLGRIETFKQSYKKRASKIFIPMIAWTLIYLIYSAMLSYKAHNIIDITPLVKSVIVGKPFYHMWYLYMLIGLYLITPILNNNIPKISRKSLWRASVLLLVFGVVNSAYNRILGINPIFILWFINYLGYFILGFLIKDSDKKLSSKFLFMLYLILGLLISSLTFYTAKHFGNLYFYDYLSPFVIISSLIVYKLFHQINIKKNILSRISHLTFGIYLIHAGVLSVLESGLRKLNTYFFDNTIITIALKFSLTVIISIIIAYLFYNSRILKKII